MNCSILHKVLYLCKVMAELLLSGVYFIIVMSMGIYFELKNAFFVVFCKIRIFYVCLILRVLEKAYGNYVVINIFSYF